MRNGLVQFKPLQNPSCTLPTDATVYSEINARICEGWEISIIIVSLENVYPENDIVFGWLFWSGLDRFLSKPMC